jgi:LPXTG-motif cell wall-anchored protein
MVRVGILTLWGAMLVVSGMLTGNPEPLAYRGATGAFRTVVGIAFGVALLAIGVWWFLALRRRRDV